MHYVAVQYSKLQCSTVRMQHYGSGTTFESSALQFPVLSFLSLALLHFTIHIYIYIFLHAAASIHPVSEVTS